MIVEQYSYQINHHWHHTAKDNNTDYQTGPILLLRVNYGYVWFVATLFCDKLMESDQMNFPLLLEEFKRVLKVGTSSNKNLTNIQTNHTALFSNKQLLKWARCCGLDDALFIKTCKIYVLFSFVCFSFYHIKVVKGGHCINCKIFIQIMHNLR